ncbi:2-methylisocitrate lyaseMethylisocitrate lyase [Vibrio nigripulchritudo SOn1]|uniref:2-methylisocitrate lyase n=1 Tax=Vibrio nigripulchritudo SOn1 TaxID=1238450 RepID=A0AAV2VNR5_9VIBR|nr:methylisocitrate lyase [Vibrio nigripulchritudo]CCO46091.1 2-methylisocitrate lyaseMethylisocitrate lyase [Vibrio nigripulchritudo SOn1]
MTAEKASPGKKFRLAVESHHPLQIVGTINAYCAMMAKNTGHQAIYLSGGGIANASYGLPDLGITTLNDVLVDVERVTNACDLPLLVDIDTGFGGAFNIARTIKSMEKAGAAAVHMEDQVAQKRCGHRPNKAIVTTDEMTDRIKAAVDAKTDSDFVLMARTDALAVEGMDSAIERCIAYVESGADMLFPEAFVELDQYQVLSGALRRHFGRSIPILANITEFGQTPLFGGQELAEHSVDMVLYPLSAFRAMNKAAEMVYSHLLNEGNQEALVDRMQTRKELYQHLNYHDYEDKLDELFAEK